MIDPIPAAAPRPGPAIPRETASLRDAARELETVFLAEMLKSAGFGAQRGEGFGGGAGEAQFTSFLVTEQARAMVEAGGIGLAETIFHALRKEQTDDVPGR